MESCKDKDGLYDGEDGGSGSAGSSATGSPDQDDAEQYVVIPKRDESVHPLTESAVRQLHADCSQTATQCDSDEGRAKAFKPLGDWLKKVCCSPTAICGGFLDDDGKLDIESMRRTIQLLFPIDAYSYQKAVADSLSTLASTLGFDVKFKRNEFCAKHPNYLHLFVFLFELPLPLLNDDFRAGCDDLCRLFLDLPVNIQAELILFWAKQPADWLKQKVTDMQQVFTVVLCVLENARTAVNEGDPAVTGPVRLLGLLRMASIVGALQHECQDPTSTSRCSSSRSPAGAGDGSAATSSLHAPNLVFEDDPLQVELCKKLKRSSVTVWDVRQPIVDEEEFVNEELGNLFDMNTHYVQFKREQSQHEGRQRRKLHKSGAAKFLFLPAYSFLLSTEARLQFLYVENKLQQETELREEEVLGIKFASLQNLFRRLFEGDFSEHYLTIRVRRDRLIEDSLIRLNNAVSESGVGSLRRPLRIEFDGEPGVDEGGVSKEFYQLVFEQLFNPDYAMFMLNDTTQQYWFNSSNEFCQLEFRLIGILLGLAVYNSIIVDVRFPSVVYRKLFNQSICLDDLRSVDPVLHSSLRQLLDHEGDDVEDVFCQTFQVTHTDVYGQLVKHDLVDDAASVMVTSYNKQEFVRLYVKHLLVDSIRLQFDEFSSGFHSVVHTSAIQPVFAPQHIEMLICGTCDLDFHSLEKATRYDNGYSATHPTIMRFWRVVHGMDDEQKKLLLKFTTGCDRVPIGGIGSQTFIIARNGDSPLRLPTAHTCFNALLLPSYKSEEVLRDRLVKAIYNCHGFGLQ